MLARVRSADASPLCAAVGCPWQSRAGPGHAAPEGLRVALCRRPAYLRRLHRRVRGRMAARQPQPPGLSHGEMAAAALRAAVARALQDRPDDLGRKSSFAIAKGLLDRFRCAPGEHYGPRPEIAAVLARSAAPACWPAARLVTSCTASSTPAAATGSPSAATW